MSMEEILTGIQERAAKANPLGATLKFDLGDSHIYIDGTGAQNEVSAEDKAADCVVSMSQANFVDLISGKLNPMTAFMMGKVKVKGDMGVAMKLQSLVG